MMMKNNAGEKLIFHKITINSNEEEFKYQFDAKIIDLALHLIEKKAENDRKDKEKQMAAKSLDMILNNQLEIADRLNRLKHVKRFAETYHSK